MVKTVPVGYGFAALKRPVLGAWTTTLTTVVAPVNSAPPAITGRKTRGQTLTASTGTWTGPPTSYAYQWKRGGVGISGATSSTYVLALGDVGYPITVSVVATNSAGPSSPALSAATSNIAAFLSISGTPTTTATQNSAYTGFSTSAAGGHTAYAYSVQAGVLPTGLSLNAATGAISGTPTVVQTQTGIVIRVTDADGLTADLPSFQIAVSAAAGNVYFFDPASKVNTTLSNNNMTAENTNGVNWANVRLNLPITGKTADVEITVVAKGAGNIIIGLCGATMPLNTAYIGAAGVDAVGLASDTPDPGAAVYDGGNLGYLHAGFGVVGDIVNMDFNDGASKVFWRVNGGASVASPAPRSKDWNGNAYFGPPSDGSIAIHPAAAVRYVAISLAPGCKVTINCGYTALTYTGGSGMIPYWVSTPSIDLEHA